MEKEKNPTIAKKEVNSKFNILQNDKLKDSSPRKYSFSYEESFKEPEFMSEKEGSEINSNSFKSAFYHNVREKHGDIDAKTEEEAEKFRIEMAKLKPAILDVYSSYQLSSHNVEGAIKSHIIGHNMFENYLKRVLSKEDKEKYADDILGHKNAVMEKELLSSYLPVIILPENFEHTLNKEVFRGLEHTLEPGQSLVLFFEHLHNWTKGRKDIDKQDLVFALSRAERKVTNFLDKVLEKYGHNETIEKDINLVKNNLNQIINDEFGVKLDNFKDIDSTLQELEERNYIPLKKVLYLIKEASQSTAKQNKIMKNNYFKALLHVKYPDFMTKTKVKKVKEDKKTNTKKEVEETFYAQVKKEDWAGEIIKRIEDDILNVSAILSVNKDKKEEEFEELIPNNLSGKKSEIPSPSKLKKTEEEEKKSSSDIPVPEVSRKQSKKPGLSLTLLKKAEESIQK